MKERVLVAMSGGVDSSVAAALLLKEGYEVAGAYMKNWMDEREVFGKCPWEQDIQDAARVAEQLGIEFRVVNLMRDYRQRVVEYLLDGYRRGLTPNPDVMCNREIKFGVFLSYALEQGFDAVATGHYARVIQAEDGCCKIFEGRDKNKDQSYFLALLNQTQLARARFPLGWLTKPQVRVLAEVFKLPNAAKKDSQGICFIGKVKMADFLEAYVPEQPGNIVNTKGERLGEHRGLHFYTIGQRRGIRVPSNQFKEAYVVLEKRVRSNELVVGFDQRETPGLYASSCRIGGISFTGHPVMNATSALAARPRYRAPATAIRFVPLEDLGAAEIEFQEPQRALAVGQVCALYCGEELIGGGVFESVA